MIGRAQGDPISITGLGAHVPARVVTNDELSTMVETSDEWIQERTGIRERRVAAPEEALTDIALPAARDALAQAYGMMAAGLSQRALVVGGDVLSRVLDWTDRSTVVLFGDGAGAVVLERTPDRGFLGFELGADGGGGIHLSLPGSGSRLLADGSGNGFVHMNGREVFKFATRVLVSSAQAVLEQCGASVEDVDLYVPHQANVRIMNHAADKLGIPRERMVVNVDRFGNTSSGSIPLALAEAQRDGRLKKGDLVLMTGMGAGLTWGSGLIEWTLEAAA